MVADLPRFAVVGAVNHGKSSIVAALAEDDRVRVSPMPGETVVNQRFELRDLLVLIDTPGFQNARKTLAEIAQAGPADDALQPYRTFIAGHRDAPAFEAECRLLQPIVDGAGIVYVVDGSLPVRDINLCEMEVLRRTGAPRLAVINRSGPADHVEAWRGRLDQHFNLVRTFDAHRATFADRLGLLGALASIAPRWKPSLDEAIGMLEADQAQRIEDAAALIAASLAACLGHAERTTIDKAADATERARAAEALKRRYRDAIATRERDLQRRMIELHAHHHLAPDDLPADLFASDLFGEETWQLFGLDTRQLIGLSTVAGGLAGAGVDAATLGHTLGLGTAIGAIAGAGGAYALGRRRPELAVRWPTATLPGLVRAALPRDAWRVGGGDLVVGPYAAENFPWILLDRALCLFATVDTRSHARRDRGPANAAALLPRLKALGLTVVDWSSADRGTCNAAFRTLRERRAASGEAIVTIRDVVRPALQRIVAAEPDIVDGLAPA